MWALILALCAGTAAADELAGRMETLERHFEALRLPGDDHHESLNPERTRQRTTFVDGTRVTVDFATGEYEIQLGNGVSPVETKRR